MVLLVCDRQFAYRSGTVFVGKKGLYVQAASLGICTYVVCMDAVRAAVVVFWDAARAGFDADMVSFRIIGRT
jgi:hypothetical protein